MQRFHVRLHPLSLARQLLHATKHAKVHLQVQVQASSRPPNAPTVVGLPHLARRLLLPESRQTSVGFQLQWLQAQVRRLHRRWRWGWWEQGGGQQDRRLTIELLAGVLRRQ